MADQELKTLWRISDHSDLSGEGGRKASARWHTKGSRIVYLADSPTSALVETLVHQDVESEDIPDEYTLLRIVISEAMAIATLEPPAHNEWMRSNESTRQIGDAWLVSLKTALARVPSVLAPYTWNYLLNPEHPDAAEVRIAEVIKERFDNRLFRFGTR
jgi:RES domain-containing protein